VASTSAANLASTHVEQLTGTAEAKSTVSVFDGSTKLGTATADASGAWSFTTAALAVGSHSFTATAADAAGNISKASTAAVVTIDTPVVDADVDIGNLSQSRGVTTIRGTADASSTIQLYDGTVLLGTATAGADGSWSFAKSGLSNTAHTFGPTEEVLRRVLRPAVLLRVVGEGGEQWKAS